MKREVVLLLAMVVLLFRSVSTCSAATCSFQVLGGLPGGSGESAVYGVSGDGSAVVGYSRNAFRGYEAFRWTEATGMVGLNDPGHVPGDGFESYAHSVSADGSVVVGYMGSQRPDSTYQAFRWTQQEGMVSLGYLRGGSASFAYGVSGDGSVVVGYGNSASGYQAFRWTEEAGMVGLGDLPGGYFESQAYGVSADGSVVVGHSKSSYYDEAFRWTEATGMVGLGHLPEAYGNSAALAVSDDGSVVVGVEDWLGEAFLWTEEIGMMALGNLPGGTSALAVSADGSAVVGGETAFIWDAHQGMRGIREILVNDCGLDVPLQSLVWASGISADGFTIVGGYAGGDAWIATIPEPATLLLLAFGAVILRRKRPIFS